MRKKKKFNISLLAYVLCVIMMIIIIPCIADISGDVFRGKGRMSGCLLYTSPSPRDCS